MKEEIRKDLLKVLEKVVPALRSEDSRELKWLSNNTIHNAGIFQDRDSVSLAVILYSLSKIFERPRLYDQPILQEMKKEVLQSLNYAKTNLKRKDEKVFRLEVKKILKRISVFEKKIGKYITEVLQQAKIKKGGRIYEHGLSVGMSAQIMGISKWELMDYLGATKVSEVTDEVSRLKSRLVNARRMFNL
ncbi:hypothetical protein HN681_01445 [archaeon]|jgi:hypothetical protein|nr:hypothetical protein [archaeon]MBT3730561.1 hypothetical protein [archaeon]MBT4669463.1 hypothetical protein [archaeon]MBT5030220.1 hypothetical protein [archaeon]MBT5287681.1 hypothetical protein [archaeon]